MLFYLTRIHIVLFLHLFNFSTQLRELMSQNEPVLEENVNKVSNDDLLLTYSGNQPIRTNNGFRLQPNNTSKMFWHTSNTAINNDGFRTASMQRRIPQQAMAFERPFTRIHPNMSIGQDWNRSLMYRPSKSLQFSASNRFPSQPNLHNAYSDAFVGPDGKLQMSICDHPNGFLRWQKKLCQQYLHLMESVVRGYFMGLRECQYQFSSHRWNCQGHNLTVQTDPNRRHRRKRRYRQLSTSKEQTNKKRQSKRLKTYLDKLLSKSTKESAFVLAVTSAGVSHAVTKACSTGLHDNCGCDRTIYDHPREPNFEWSGCSDNIHFGAAFSRQFLDVREKNRLKRNPKLGMTNLHNNHVGRQSVINKMQVQCKCHGVSGSCEMRTCWRSLPKFRELGAHLQELFHRAVYVDYVDKRLLPKKELDQILDDSRMANTYYARDAVFGHSLTADIPAPTENDLIYTTLSPTFCYHDPRFGSVGTHGRRCEENGDGLNSCKHLCCDRGFKRQTFDQQERCHCKFQWCCKVICQTCHNRVVISTCN